ncbi:MAG TPA: DUF1491 family protein [Sphingomicrobium sp.]|nr:DUF1491 family protein [Sphingomicrobium sp.]
MTERLPAHLEAAALLRRAEAAGGFGTVLHKGDPDRGALILFLTSRGTHHACLERTLGPTGCYDWHRAGPEAGAGQETIADWSYKRVRFDSDSWLIELDVPLPERFVAETISQG